MMVSVFISEKLMKIKDLDPAMCLSQTWYSPLDWRKSADDVPGTSTPNAGSEDARLDVVPRGSGCT